MHINLLLPNEVQILFLLMLTVIYNPVCTHGHKPDLARSATSWHLHAALLEMGLDALTALLSE